MGFFLLGRGREAGELRLISTEVYAGRSEAIEALTKLSGEPGFEHRDAEVFVLDLDTGMPVVLVAPAAPASAIEPIPAEEPEVAEETAVAEEPETGAGVWEAPAEPEPEVEATEPEPELEVEAAEEPDDLAGALKRAAGALESEGIVAPESIGSADTVAETADEASEPLSVLDQPWLAEIGEPEVEAEAPDEPEAEVEPEPELETVAEPEPEAEPAAESDTEAAEPEPEPEPEVVAEPASDPEADAAWPWDTAASADAPAEAAASDEPVATEPAPYVPDPFEEPAIDGGDFLKVQIGDESSAPRTVVMGSYAEPAEEQPQQAAEPASVTGPDTEIDSILADLGPVETPSQDAPADETPAVGSDMADLTCEDCVYVNTCPNKEDLDPARCGNFQWRSV